MWKFINGNLINPDHLIAIVPEMGMNENGDFSFLFKFILSDGTWLESEQINFGDEKNIESGEIYFPDNAIDEVISKHFKSLMKYLQISIDLDSYWIKDINNPYLDTDI